MIDIVKAIRDDLRSKFPDLDFSVIPIGFDCDSYDIMCQNRRMLQLLVYPEQLELFHNRKSTMLCWEQPDLFDVIYEALENL